MFGWFKKKPVVKVKCVVCGREANEDAMQRRCKDGPVCVSCTSNYTEDPNAAPSMQLINISANRLRFEKEKQEQRDAEIQRQKQSGDRVFSQQITGIPGITIGNATLTDKGILFDWVGTEALIPYNRVIACDAITECITTADSASPGLRAIVGGILFGNVGAIGGAASALNAKTLTAVHILKITYKSKTGQTKEITLTDIIPTSYKPNQTIEARECNGGNPYLRFVIHYKDKYDVNRPKRPGQVRKIEL